VSALADEQVDQVGLLVIVLVQQQVQVVEGVASHEPVVLLVKAGQDDAVGQDMVQQLAALQPGLMRQGDRQEGVAHHRRPRPRLVLVGVVHANARA
jgi:hypothetical protein